MRFVGRKRWCWLVVLLPWLCPAAASAEDRVALVIGNSRYDSGMLANPGNDADSIEAALQSLGFTVLKRNDLDRPGMEQAVQELRRKLTRQSVALFFYAGHGLQAQEQTYLVPVRAEAREEHEVRDQFYPVAELLAVLEESDSRLKVVVLDCYRDKSLNRLGKPSRPLRGSAPITGVPQGTLIAFAMAEGEGEADGTDGNCAYTRRLCAVLNSRPAGGLELLDAFRKAGVDLRRETKQIAWMHMGVREPFYLWRDPGLTDYCCKHLWGGRAWESIWGPPFTVWNMREAVRSLPDPEVPMRIGSSCPRQKRTRAQGRKYLRGRATG